MNIDPVRIVGDNILVKDGFVERHMLLGSYKKKGTNYVLAEDNLVNRLALNLPLRQLNQVQAPTDQRLLDYQVKDIQKMASLGNCANFNRMGYGKTVETIETLKLLNATDTVIVAPKPVCDQWLQQYKVWWPEMEHRVGVCRFDKETVILNYEKLLSTITLVKLRSNRHHAVVFDEVHKLKNPKSKRTAAAKLIPASVHIGLTGTPILRKPDDLWSILNAVDPWYSGKSYWNFVNYFCNVVTGPFGKEIKGITTDRNKLQILHQLLDLVTIRNPQIEIASGKRSVEIFVQMTGKQRELYNKIRKLVLDELPQNCTISNGAVHALRLQQATSWPGLFDESVPGAKFEWIKEFCSNTDEQVLVLSKFAQTAHALAEYLNDCGISATLYTGVERPRERYQNKLTFMTKQCQVLVGSISAVGIGVDGLQCARLGIMIDKDWSPEINQQCEDRLHRRGQTEPVIWYYLNCAKSFDHHVGKINLTKADSIRRALEDDRI